MSVEAIAAEVHQRTAGKRERPTGVIGCGGRVDHPHLDMPEFAELAGRQQLVQSSGDWVVQIVEPVGDHHPGASTRIANLGRLRGVARERLLGQDMLAGRDRREVPGRVQPVGQRVVDGLHLWVGDHVRVRVEDPLHAVGGGERLGPAAVARCDRHQARAR